MHRRRDNSGRCRNRRSSRDNCKKTIKAMAESSIVIHSGITSHWLWQDAEKLKWWLDLLFMAEAGTRKEMHDTHTVTLENGQVVASVETLRIRWGKNHQTVLRFLKALEKEKFIKRTIINRNTPLITICKNALFQSENENGVYRLNDEAVYRQTACTVYRQKTDLNASLSDTSAYTPESGVYRQNDETVYRQTYRQAYRLNEDEAVQHAQVIDTARFMEFWNNSMKERNAVIPQIRNIQGKRKNHLLARCREHGREALAEAVKKTAESDYLNGRNAHGFVASFDWVMLPGNFPKVIEGNYDNYENNKQDKETRRKRTETHSTSPSDYDGAF